MKKIKLVCLSAFAILLFCSHDMFLKFDSFFLEPNKEAILQLFNGTFEKSDNSIDRNRMEDVSLAGNENRNNVEDSQWFVKDSITFLKFKTGEAGTWVAGVSTKPRDFEMKAEKFNDYLKNDGVLDILEDRKANGKLNDDAFEKYSKHVKTIFQVGDKLTDDWSVNLGYPIEFIPLENPYEIHSGHSLPVKLLRDGKPLANHFVYVGHKPSKNKNHSHSHNHGESDTHEHKHGHDDNEHSHSHDDSNKPHKHGDETHTHEDESATHLLDNDDEKHGHKHDNESHSHGDKREKQSHNSDTESDHVHDEVSQLKTNDEGIVNVFISDEGIWFLRTIDMVELDDEKLTHKSNWATLTFEIGSGLGHSHDDEDVHKHEHEHDEEGFPSYLFWIGSIILVAILFFLFNKKK